MAEKLYDLWAKRNPNWEKRFEDSIIKNFSDYGKGVTTLGEAKGKLFGAGYEVFIIAFFIGLYYNQRRKLIDDSTKIKSLGQPIQYWGNIDSVKGRKAYPKLKEFIFLIMPLLNNHSSTSLMQIFHRIGMRPILVPKML